MTPEWLAEAQRKERLLQWLVPAATAVMLVLNAKMGEQQQPAQVAKGFLRRLVPAA